MDPRIQYAQYQGPEFFLDIADDGFAISGELYDPDGKFQEARQKLVAGEFQQCTTTMNFFECEDRTCGCSRMFNPKARDHFKQSAVQSLAEVCTGRDGEVVYASLGSGLLRFDLEFLEAALAAGIPVTTVHLVDPNYSEDATSAKSHRGAVAQFCAWFMDRGVDVYAHTSVDEFAIRVRKSGALPVAVLQADCAPLAEQFDDVVRPQLEEVLHYGGLFLALTPRGGVRQDDKPGAMDAWGEVWRLHPESGRLRSVSRTRYVMDSEPKLMGDDVPLPPAANH